MDQSHSIASENNISIEIPTQGLWQKYFGAALQDYFDSFTKWRLWYYMAYSEIRRRYKRTLIGPFWTTLSLAIFITSMGLLFSYLWKSNTKDFLPYFASGFVCWTMISTLITDSCMTFIAQEGLLKQIALPYTSFAWMIVVRNFLIFLHQIPIFLVIALIFHVHFNLNTLLLIPGLLLVFLTGSWICILFGMLCARFRDMQQIVTSLLQISMFVTPIFWPVKQLGQSFKAYLLVNGNPLYHYVSVIREPLLGQQPSTINWLFVIGVTVIGWMITMMVLNKKYRQIIFWIL